MTPGQIALSLLLGTSGVTVSIFGVANAAAGADYSALYNLGAIGVVLAWMMWKVEPRMKAVEAALDRATRANMLMLIAAREVSDAVKGLAKGIEDEVEAAEEGRKK